jgi:hypothetical protein
MELTTFERRPELDRYECVLTPAYMNGMPNKVCLLCPVEPAIEVMVYHLNLEPSAIEWMYEITARSILMRTSSYSTTRPCLARIR